MPKLPAGIDREDMMEALTEGVREAFIALGSSHGRFDIPHELLFDAVREGTRQAIWQMITSATAMPGHDFYDTLKKAITDAFSGLDLSNLKS